MSDETTDYTVNELMAATICGMLGDNELGFVGIGTAGRAFTLAVGIPIVEARLAQMRHAPNFTIYWGNLLSPDLDDIPESPLHDTYTRWPAAAALSDTGQKLDMLMRGDFDVSFESAAEVDQYGNLNITLIGDAKHPKPRLVGCLAQPEHLCFVRRPIIVCDLSRRTFVEKVSYIPALGTVAVSARERIGDSPVQGRAPSSPARRSSISRRRADECVCAVFTRVSPRKRYAI